MLQNIQLRKIGPWKHRYTPPPSNRSLDNGYTSNAEDNLAYTTNKDYHSSTKTQQWRKCTRNNNINKRAFMRLGGLRACLETDNFLHIKCY